MAGLFGLGGINDDYGNINVRTNPPVTMGAWENDCNGIIDDEPDAETVCENGTVSFSVAISGVGSPAYQWQVSSDGGNTWTDLADGLPYLGVQTDQLTINPVALGMNGYQYRCVMTDSDNGCVYNSDGAVLTVRPAPVTSPIWHQ
jgi:hypothetical protein